jgi:hypothetical protein
MKISLQLSGLKQRLKDTDKGQKPVQMPEDKQKEFWRRDSPCAGALGSTSATLTGARSGGRV